MIEIVIERPRTEVHRAIVQFVAQRSYRMTNPWWTEGLRIEAPQWAERRLGSEGVADPFDGVIRSSREKTWWATLLDLPQVPRIELDIKRSRGCSVVKVKISDHSDSTKLAAELQAYLLDARAYNVSGLAACTACGASVSNIVARYCGRCGRELVATKKADASPATSNATVIERVYAATRPERPSAQAEAMPRASSEPEPVASSPAPAGPVEVVEPIETPEVSSEPGADTVSVAPPDVIEAGRDSLDANVPAVDTPVAADVANVETDPLPVDEPATEAMAEAEDDPEPPQRALAED